MSTPPRMTAKCTCSCPPCGIDSTRKRGAWGRADGTQRTLLAGAICRKPGATAVPHRISIRDIDVLNTDVGAPKGDDEMSRSGIITDEVARVQAKLEADDKLHFLPLLTVSSVKDAVRTARRSYSSSGGMEGKPGGETYMEEVIAPLLDQIDSDHSWPACAHLDLCYEQTDEAGVTYRGLGVSLEITTPEQTFPGFSLAILDLWYGRFT